MNGTPAVEFVSLRRAALPDQIPSSGNGGRPVVELGRSLAFNLAIPPASDQPPPAEPQVSLRRTAEPPPAPTVLQPGETLTREEDKTELLKRGRRWLGNLTRKSGEVWQRLRNSKAYKNAADYIKSHHPLISLVAGPVIGAAIGFVDPKLGQFLAENAGIIRTGAGLSMTAFGMMELAAGRETNKGRFARAARYAAMDVSLATMTAPFGVGVGIGGHEMMSEALKHFPSTPAPVEATAAATAQAIEQTPVAATQPAPTSEPSPTVPDIQPNWEVGHPPSAEQLDWARSHGNITESGGFQAYNLDSDDSPEVYVHGDSGHIWWETPDGKWAVDSMPNDGVLKPDAVYSSPPVPDTSGSSNKAHGLASMLPDTMRGGGEPSLPDYKDINGDGRWDLFKMADGTWRLDTDGSSYTLDASSLPVVDPTKMLAEQQVNITGLVDNGGVWDWANAQVTSPDGTYKWKFEDTGTGDGSWVQSDLLSPIERGVHDVNPDVTISAGQGKWHAGENYLKAILNNPATAADTDLVGKLSDGTGANTIAVDAIKDVLERHGVTPDMTDPNNPVYNIDPSYNKEIGAEIQTTFDKITGWFESPGYATLDDTQKNKILAEMSSRGLMEVKNLTVEQLDTLSKLAAALKGGG